MQSKRTKEVRIGEHTFFITKLPPTLALDLLSEILKGVGPALGTLVEKFNLKQMLLARAQGRSIAEVEIDLSGLGDAIRQLVMTLGKRELRSIAGQALASTTCATAGGKLVWKAQEEPLVDTLDMSAFEVLVLIWAAIDWNFGDFSSALSARGPGRAEGASGSAV